MVAVDDATLLYVTQVQPRYVGERLSQVYTFTDNKFFMVNTGYENPDTKNHIFSSDLDICQTYAHDYWAQNHNIWINDPISNTDDPATPTVDTANAGSSESDVEISSFDNDTDHSSQVVNILGSDPVLTDLSSYGYTKDCTAPEYDWHENKLCREGCPDGFHADDVWGACLPCNDHKCSTCDTKLYECDSCFDWANLKQDKTCECPTTFKYEARNTICNIGTCENGKLEFNEGCETKDRYSKDDGCHLCQIERGWVCTHPKNATVSSCREACGNGIVSKSENCEYQGLDRSPGCNAGTCKANHGWFCDKAEPKSNCKQVCKSPEECLGWVDSCLEWWQDDTCRGAAERGSAKYMECVYSFIADNKGRCTWPEWLPCKSLDECTELAHQCSTFTESDCLKSGTNPETCFDEFIADYPGYKVLKLVTSEQDCQMRGTNGWLEREAAKNCQLKRLHPQVFR